MVKYLQYYLTKRKMKKYIGQAIRIIYTRQSHLDEAIETEFVRGKKYFDLICAYVAIHTAAKAKEPITKSDVTAACHELTSPLVSLETPEQYHQSLEILKDRAHVSLDLAERDFLFGRAAYEGDQYSLKGMMYDLIKSKRAPLSQKERDEVEKIYYALLENKRQMEAHEKKTH